MVALDGMNYRVVARTFVYAALRPGMYCVHGVLLMLLLLLVPIEAKRLNGSNGPSSA